MAQLLTTDWLIRNLTLSDLVLADVRWHADRPAESRSDFEKVHIPRAIFVDLDTVLSDRSDLTKGRHPLPDPERFCRDLAKLGIGRKTRVVAYDDVGGSIAARLWWMLKWIGVDNCALLDGGLTKWMHEGKPIQSGPAAQPAEVASHIPKPNSNLVITKGDIPEAQRNGLVLIDARAPERFRGEIEPIDKVAGHIPGAVNIYWADCLHSGPDMSFRNAPELHELFRGFGIQPEYDIACYCGSGVTSCLTVFALGLAGFENVRLYPGSWSEWIVDAPSGSIAREAFE